MKARGRRVLGHEGSGNGRWTLLDFGAIVIHVFYHPVREFYDLESLWIEAPRVKIDDPARRDPHAARRPLRRALAARPRRRRQSRVKIVVLAVGKMRDRHLGAPATTTSSARGATCRSRSIEVDDDAELAAPHPGRGDGRGARARRRELGRPRRFTDFLEQADAARHARAGVPDRRRRRAAARRRRARRCACRCRR